jgi:hypothetical protein
MVLVMQTMWNSKKEVEMIISKRRHGLDFQKIANDLRTPSFNPSPFDVQVRWEQIMGIAYYKN